MIVYTLMARGSTVLAEYGIGGQDFGLQASELISKKQKPGSKLIKLDSNFAAILNKSIDSEVYSFLAIIKNNQSRDLAFDLLEKICNFYEKEKEINSSKITSEITLHMSKQIRIYMEEVNSMGEKNKLEKINTHLDSAQSIARTNITSMLDQKMKLEDIEYNSNALRDSAFAFEQGGKRLERQLKWQKTKMYIMIGGICVVTLFVLYKIF